MEHLPGLHGLAIHRRRHEAASIAFLPVRMRSVVLKPAAAKIRDTNSCCGREQNSSRVAEVVSSLSLTRRNESTY
jgi:hypothetical protein